MRPSIERPAIVSPRYSMTEPMPPPVPMRPMMARITSLAVAPGGQLARDGDGHRAGPLLGQRLGGEHVLDLAGADAEGQRAEGAVGGGVAVAAHDGHARQGAALLGADHVDDALVGVAHAVVGDAELGACWRRSTSSCLAEIGSATGWSMSSVGTLWSAVATVRSGRRTRAAGQPDAVEGLRAGDLVDEVEVDVEQVGLAGCAAHHVAVPDLLGERLGHGIPLDCLTC